MSIKISEYVPEFIKQQRLAQISAKVEPQDMTYRDALHLAWEVLEEARVEAVEAGDTELVTKYETAIALLSKIFLRDII